MQALSTDARSMRALGAVPQDRLADFLVLNFASPDQNQDEVWKQALRTAAIYRAHNMWRYNQHASPNIIRESPSQHFREVVRDHPRATRALDSIFAIPGL